MGKKKWERVRLADLASVETQARVLKVMALASGPPAPEVSPDVSEKRPSETGTTGR